jgi:hypothetical protein
MRRGFDQKQKFVIVKKAGEIGYKGAAKIAGILTANELWKVETRKRRPLFYRNLSQRMPNGL